MRLPSAYLSKDGLRACLGLFGVLSFAGTILAQDLPNRPDRPWLTGAESTVSRQAEQSKREELALAQEKKYTLPELIDFAEAHSPETREAWQAARQRMAALHIAQSALYPALDVGFTALTNRNGVLLYDTFVIQQLGIGEVAVKMNYTLFDANGRVDQVAQQHNLLRAASFSFNDAHRQLLYSVMHAYYLLLDAKGQRIAAESNLTSAQAVSDATQARFDNGLATLPDLSEAKSTAAQANYELQLRIGNERKATGYLATLVTAPADTSFDVQSIDELTIPTTLSADGHELIEVALKERPDLLRQFSVIDAAKSGVREARSRYYPTVNFSGSLGELRAWGLQSAQPGAYATGRVYDAELTLNWNVFDGNRRRSQVREAEAAQKREEETLRGLRDRIESEVWQAFVDADTAFRQRDAASALLRASQDSYEQSLESYKYGVRNIVDVLTAQRQLAAARFEDVSSRVAVLDSLAQVSYRTGELLRTREVPKP
ncbi:outer membrane efflux protein [Terriglobus saanensis SP1PR4]|uniref:Outer membrane efflux protein n=1 Tax=Terriglobus saanensis (strain ATCC BAA-1853 / DSM 23119 / SP1PR4) TaxID=401053 RepID=E8V5V1_TERSS|nr:outer membrane efflux protein [Terriglobus saanensis SP1PR4]